VKGLAPLPLSAALIMGAAVIAVFASTLPGRSIDPHPSCIEVKSESGYFPVMPPGSEFGIDEFRREWYSHYLRAMGEPCLQCVSRYPVYRFLWLRTFHHPVVVRIEKRKDGMHLFAVELDGAGGYEPGLESRRIERVLSVREGKVFDEAVAIARVLDAPDRRELVGLDGSEWIVEARDGARYQIHDVWTPERGRIHQLGMVFIALTGWSIPKDEMY